MRNEKYYKIVLRLWRKEPYKSFDYRWQTRVTPVGWCLPSHICEWAERAFQDHVMSGPEKERHLYYVMTARTLHPSLYFPFLFFFPPLPERPLRPRPCLPPLTPPTLLNVVVSLFFFLNSCLLVMRYFRKLVGQMLQIIHFEKHSSVIYRIMLDILCDNLFSDFACKYLNDEWMPKCHRMCDKSVQAYCHTWQLLLSITIGTALILTRGVFFSFK